MTRARPALIATALLALTACAHPSGYHPPVPTPTVSGLAMDETAALAAYQPVLDDLRQRIAASHPGAALTSQPAPRGVVTGCYGAIGPSHWGPLEASDEMSRSLSDAYTQTLAAHGFGAPTSVRLGGPTLEWRAFDARGAVADAELAAGWFDVAVFYPALPGHCA